MTVYNKSDVFDTQIKDLIEQIQQICKKENIPFFFSAAVENNVADTKYEVYALTATPMELSLAEDDIVKHINVFNGFDTVPPENLPELEFSADE